MAYQSTVERMDDLIFDVGAFKGQDTEFYLKLGYRVVAVEANPVFAEETRQRNELSFSSGRLTIVNCAIGDREGKVEFYVHDHEDWSSLFKSERFTGDSFRVIDVEAWRPMQLFERFGVPRYVKIDIEGADHLVIDAICALPTKPLYLSYELGPTESDCARKLQKAGYEYFKLVDQSENKNRTYSFADSTMQSYQFTNYHSGPYGDDIPGEWLTLDELYAEIDAIEWSAGLARWFDIHAKLRAE